MCIVLYLPSSYQCLFEVTSIKCLLYPHGISRIDTYISTISLNILCYSCLIYTTRIYVDQIILNTKLSIYTNLNQQWINYMYTNIFDRTYTIFQLTKYISLKFITRQLEHKTLAFQMSTALSTCFKYSIKQ